MEGFKFTKKEIERYLFNVCVKYGYCLDPISKNEMLNKLEWASPDDFVERIMILEGLSPEEKPRHFKNMVSEIRADLANGNPR